MTMLRHSFSLLLIISVLLGCGTQKPFYSFQHRKWKQSIKPEDSSIHHTVFLVGDAGAPKSDDPLFNMLGYHLEMTRNASNDVDNSLIYLGDNIYEHGLSKRGSFARDNDEKAIITQMDMSKKFDGRVFFIPGNHDWNHSNSGGYRAVIRQQRFVESYLDSASFFPKNGCPGPVEVPVGDDMVMIFLDTEWYLHDHYKPYYPDCTVESKRDFFLNLKGR